MSWPDFISRNRWQKLGSLVLAVLIWLTVNADLGVERFTARDAARVRVFEHVPVSVLAPGNDAGRYRIEPARVAVEVHGEPAALRGLQPGDLEVYVNLSTSVAATNAVRRIHVRAPGVRHAETMPEEVHVSRLP
jgi:YbbR domain-containing protein